MAAPSYPGHLPKVRRVKRKEAAVASVPEKQLQRQCEEYLEARGIRYLHIPDSTLRACAWESGLSIGQKREIADYLKGTPDLLIFRRVRDTNRVLAVELKCGRNQMSEGQRLWAHDILVHEVRDSFDGFRRLVDDFMGAE